MIFSGVVKAPPNGLRRTCTRRKPQALDYPASVQLDSFSQRRHPPPNSPFFRKRLAGHGSRSECLFCMNMRGPKGATTFRSCSSLHFLRPVLGPVMPSSNPPHPAPRIAYDHKGLHLLSTEPGTCLIPLQFLKPTAHHKKQKRS